ncbi:MAG: tRNA pseudouridine(13) synthase TruD [Candidatus Thorarchaeota archaeon]
MNKPHPLELSIGMENYSTSFRGVGGNLKSRYEDFIVEEIDSDHQVAMASIPFDAPCVVPDPLEIRGVEKKARNIHFTMQKMGIATLDAASLLAASLKISRHMVTYAGLKDKRALTAQRMAIPKFAIDKLKELSLHRIWIRDLSYSRRSINIGDLWGNKFSILLRDMDVSCEEALENIAGIQNTSMMNYFGIQRFGVSRPFTHLVGRAIIKREYEEAIDLILTESSRYEPQQVAEIRRRIKDEGISERLIEELPQDLRYEKLVARSLLKHPDDYQLAFSRITPRIQTLFIHAYQSYLFNRTLSLRFQQGMSLSEPMPGDFLIRLDQAHTGRDDWMYVTERNQESLLEKVKSGEYGLAGTIVGYASKMPNAPQSDLIRRVLKSEGVSLSSFRNADNQHLDSPGGLHLLAIEIPDIEGSCTSEGLRVEFKLRKGSYATVVLRELMKNSPLNRS